ncbi:SOCS box domain-containing protein [Trichonephila inaurata madagascariensis]|uniref:SOCS box domain-containing protein n=1 Tax=Trichonephila inaurata madagascariensis TaxID=2747483 RepID=A0A8X6YRV6_9ARAC|nr:SOCS box domain-containing protein [Trichonephila inaurata madagascariensis]
MYSSYRDSCCFIRAMNIVDYEKKSRDSSFRSFPNLKWHLISLETLIKEMKWRSDVNAVECDTYYLFQFLKRLQTLLFEKGIVSSKTAIRCLYLKRKLLIILKASLINEYIDFLETKLKTPLKSSELEVFIKKFVTVCNVQQPQTELIAESVHQYEFIAELLNHCYKADVQDSQLVTSLVKMAIDRHVIKLSCSRTIKQPSYPQGFLKYILEHVTREKFDIETYCNDHPQTLWEYSKNFSVLKAISIGNLDRTVTLLKYGFEVLTEQEMRRCGHGFPLTEEVITRTHRMTLRLMSSIRSINLLILKSLPIYNKGLSTASNDQKDCFQFIWRAIPDPIPTCAELESSIANEYSLLAQNGVLRPKRFCENTDLCIMYKKCITNLACVTKEPRSLKHLSRCAVRKSLKECYNLPHGIFQLGLPETLEQYLDLEME